VVRDERNDTVAGAVAWQCWTGQRRLGQQLATRCRMRRTRLRAIGARRAATANARPQTSAQAGTRFLVAVRLRTVLSARLDLPLAIVQVLLLHRSSEKKLARADAGTTHTHANNDTPNLAIQHVGIRRADDSRNSRDSSHQPPPAAGAPLARDAIAC
jgi:hypothetical protein